MQIENDKLCIKQKELEAEMESLKATCASKEDMEKQIAICRSDMPTQIRELLRVELQQAIDQSPTIQMISRQSLNTSMKVDKVEQKVSEMSIKLDKKDQPSPPLITGEAESDSNPHDEKVTKSHCTISC